MYRLLSIGIVLPFLFLNCIQKKKEQQAVFVPKRDTLKAISIRFVGEIEFRKSYAHLQFIEDEKEAAREEKRVDKSNPTTEDENEPLREKLERFGFIKGHELLLSMFKYSTSATHQMKDSSGKVIKIIFDSPAVTNDNYWKMTVYGNIDSSFVKIDPSMMDLKYALLDVIPGGNKEIVVLNEWYIANSYNYDFLVYEIKTN